MATDKVITVILEVCYDYKGFLDKFNLTDNEDSKKIWDKMCENADYNKKTKMYEIRNDGEETEHHEELLEQMMDDATEEIVDEKLENVKPVPANETA